MVNHQTTIIVLLSALTVIASMGIRQSFGLFLQPISDDLGFGREVFSLALALQNLLFGLPLLGMVADRFGSRWVIFGGALVVIFILIYYKLSGAIAVTALSLNIVLLTGALAYFGAALTLPGIAGIILTVGMAIDANVLVFERIREEIKIGKTVRAAIEAGFSKAFRTIVDANITTFIAAVVLFQFGTGPIKGFAITLCIGIAASMFTAVFVSRTIFDGTMSRKKLDKLSI